MNLNGGRRQAWFPCPNAYGTEIDDSRRYSGAVGTLVATNLAQPFAPNLYPVNTGAFLPPVIPRRLHIGPQTLAVRQGIVSDLGHREAPLR